MAYRLRFAVLLSLAACSSSSDIECLHGECNARGDLVDGIADKSTVILNNFVLASGDVIWDVRVGVETYGTLNADASNVVLLAPFLAGHSHAAGRFSPEDAAAGWWDDLIGPGKVIDTEHWFVVSTDAFSLPRSKPGFVVTTGPTTITPDGLPYGAAFPEIRFADQVELQRDVLETLGITRVHTVAGASMGGMIALEWAAQHPELVDNVIAVAAPGTYSDPQRAGLRFARSLIESDPNWLGGNYLQAGVEPDEGVAGVLVMLSSMIGPKLSAPATELGWDELEGQFQAFFDQDLADIRSQLPDFDSYVQRARNEFDGGHFVTTFEMFEQYDPLPALANAQGVHISLVGFEDDRLVTIEHLRDVSMALTANSVEHELVVLPGGAGHLSCLTGASSFGSVFTSRLEPSTPQR